MIGIKCQDFCDLKRTNVVKYYEIIYVSNRMWVEDFFFILYNWFFFTNCYIA